LKEDVLGGLGVRIAGGDDREGGGEGPALVLLHGYGAPGTDLVPLWRQVEAPASLRFVFPEAPLTVDVGFPGMSGRAWWHLDVMALQERLARGPDSALAAASEIPAGLDEAREAVLRLLDELSERYRVAPERVVLGGFSQGAMVACDAALRSRRPLAGLVLLSAAPVALTEWRRTAPLRAGLSVLQSHGRADPILPFAGAELLRDALTEAGLSVEFLAFNGGHGIPAGATTALGPFLARTLGETA
jgi:phospholipase/carboxylesterase